MTCRERLKIEHPEYVDERYPAGCRACPSYYGYNNGISRYDCDIIRNNLGCEYCWDQEIIEYKDERDEQIAKLSRMLESKNGLIGTLKQQLRETQWELHATKQSYYEMEDNLLRKLAKADREARLYRHVNDILEKKIKDLGGEI